MLFAQQDPQFGLNMFNHMAVNPGYAGANGAICATAINRQQWVGFDGAPKTTVFSINSPVKLVGINSGVGLTVLSDNIGFEKNLGINLAYAYRLKLGDGELGIGFNIGILNKAIDGKWISPDSQTGGGNVYDDQSVPHSESKVTLDLGLGAYYIASVNKNDEFYVGLSTSHLNESEIKYQSASPYLKRHYYLAAGYSYQLPSQVFELRPSIFLKSDGVVSTLDINATLRYNKRVFGGISYRADTDIVALIGVEFVNNLHFAYGYEIVTSDIKGNTSGTHEFMIGYCFNIVKTKKKSKYGSVRY